MEARSAGRVAGPAEIRPAGPLNFNEIVAFAKQYFRWLWSVRTGRGELIRR
jgi:hypothetical protein